MEDELTKEKMLKLIVKYESLIYAISEFAQCDVRLAEQIYQPGQVENMNISFFHLNEFMKLSRDPMGDICQFLADENRQ